MNKLHLLITAHELLTIKTNQGLIVCDASGVPNERANYEANHLEEA